MVDARYTIRIKWGNEITIKILEWLVEIGTFAKEGLKTGKRLEKICIDSIQEIYNTAIQYKNYSVALVAADSEVRLDQNLMTH